MSSSSSSPLPDDFGPSDDALPRDNPRGSLPGICGVIKQQPEDFEVEEIAAYEPSGEGEHLFLWIEKRDTSSEQMTWRIARTLGLSPAAIGVAGIKDRRAVTRQYISVPATCRRPSALDRRRGDPCAERPAASE